MSAGDWLPDGLRESDMTSVFGLPIPACPVHGRMKLRYRLDWWTCPGWDGEGCDTPNVTMEDLHRQAVSP